MHTHKFWVRTLSICACTLMLAACGSKLTQANFSKITNGMSQAEVTQLLGEPQSSQGGGLLGFSASTAMWKDDKHQITVVFLNEKVTSKVFGDAEAAPVK